MDSDPEAVRRVLAGLMSREGTLISHFCHACVQGIGVDGASVALLSGRGLRETLCANDEIALAADQVQFMIGEGPCIEAHHSGLPTEAADIDTDGARRWPAYTAALAEAAPAIRAVAAFPIRLRDDQPAVGVLDLFNTAPGALTGEQRVRAEHAARLAAPIILRALPDALSEGHRLQAFAAEHGALDRHDVYCATGVLMAQHRLSAEDAFARLRAHAFAAGRTVEDTAQEILTGELTLPD